MYQNGTDDAQEHVTAISLKYIAVIGSAMVFAFLTAMTVVQADGSDAQPPKAAMSEQLSSDDVTECAADYDGTLSCAVSHGQPPVENLPSTT